MKNSAGDEPFGLGPGAQLFAHTDKITAFDVNMTLSGVADLFVPDDTTGLSTKPLLGQADRTRKVALFEGTDEFGRLQPLLGTAEPATDYLGNPINWPPSYAQFGLSGQIEGTVAWHSPTTENPALGDTEIWEIWNVSGDSVSYLLRLDHADRFLHTNMPYSTFPAPRASPFGKFRSS